MLFDKKIIELKSLIYKTLSPYLSSKCAFLELPYYPNVGDLLIWEGTEKFIEDHGMECVYKASRWSYKYRRLDKNIKSYYKVVEILEIYGDHVRILD